MMARLQKGDVQGAQVAAPAQIRTLCNQEAYLHQVVSEAVVIVDDHDRPLLRLAHHRGQPAGCALECGTSPCAGPPQA